MSSPLPRSNPFAIVALVALLAASAVVRPPGATAGSESAVPAAGRPPAASVASDVAGPVPAPMARADAGASTPTDVMADVPVQQLTVLTDGRAVPLPFVDVLPAVANGRTVLVLRDGAASGERWPAAVAALADAGFRVIVPQPLAPPARPDLVAGHMALLLDSLGAAGTTVVGEGEGAAVAVRLAERSPRVRRLALIAHGDVAGLTDAVRRVALPTLVVTEDGARGAAAALPDARLATLARDAAPTGAPASFVAPLLAFLDD